MTQDELLNISENFTEPLGYNIIQKQYPEITFLCTHGTYLDMRLKTDIYGNNTITGDSDDNGQVKTITFTGAHFYIDNYYSGSIDDYRTNKIGKILSENLELRMNKHWIYLECPIKKEWLNNKNKFIHDIIGTNAYIITRDIIIELLKAGKFQIKPNNISQILLDNDALKQHKNTIAHEITINDISEIIK